MKRKRANEKEVAGLLMTLLPLREEWRKKRNPEIYGISDCAFHCQRQSSCEEKCRGAECEIARRLYNKITEH